MAEVLITLGVIGVVAAMTLPAVLNSIQNKQLEAALKKSYSVLSQVTQRVVNEDLGGVIESKSSYEMTKLFVKYYNNSNVCSGKDNKNGCPDSGDVGMCTFMQRIYKTYNAKSNAGCVGNDAVSNTVDSTTIYFDQPNWSSPTPEAVAGKVVMLIDVNGWQKKPNRLGHDLFMFQVSDKGQLLPMGTENSVFPSGEYCSTSSSAQTNGYGCTSRALLEKDFFKNLPK